MNKLYLKVLLIFVSLSGIAQENINKNKFRQLNEELPTPNVYRTAAGMPGHQYYQQQADYVIDLVLDDKKQRIYSYFILILANLLIFPFYLRTLIHLFLNHSVNYPSICLFLSINFNHILVHSF